MDRRNFVKTGVAAGVTASVSGCGSTRGVYQRPEPGPMPADMDKFLAGFDQATAALSDRSRLRRLAPKGAQAALNDEELRKLERYTKALYVSGSFLDLPEEGQLHPGVQQRMVDYYPDLNDTMDELVTDLDQMSDSQRRLAQRALREEKDIPLHISQELNRLAKVGGVSTTRRAQVRSGMTQAGFRLRTQAPSTVIDEYVEQIHRMAPSDASEAAIQQRVLSLVGSDFLMRAQTQAVPATGAPGAPMAPARTRGRRGTGVLKAGGITLGIGVVTLAAGAIAVSSGVFAGVFAMTAGVIGIIVGIILVIVGAVRRASS